MSLVALAQNQEVTDFLLDPGILASMDEIAVAHGLPVERSEEFLDLTDAVLRDEMLYPQMPLLLAPAFGITQSQADKLAADIAGYRLLPLALFLPGIESQITVWGGDLKKYPSRRLHKRKLTAEQLARTLTTQTSLALNESLIKRLAFLSQEFFSGKNDQAAFETLAARPTKVGGLALNPDQIQALLQAITTERSLSELIDPDAKQIVTTDPKDMSKPASVSVAAEVPVAVVETPTVVAPLVPVPTPTKQEIEIAPSHELAAEVPVVNKPESVPKQTGLGRAQPKQVIAPIQEIDPNELKTQLKRATAVRKQVAPVIDALQIAVLAATGKVTAILKSKKISEKVFADVAGKAIRGLRDIYQTRDLIERDWKLKGEDLAGVMQAIADGLESYGKAARSRGDGQGRAQPEQVRSESDELDEKFASLTKPEGENEAPEKARAQLTLGSVSMGAGAGGQRKMVDIVSSNRLAGPIEQLGKMTPAEFRRLASDPSEAGQKIDDLLSALEKTSYEERVKGVLAWRESPMNQLYLKITEEALSAGLALPEISSKRRAAGQDSLSPGEVKALALLNSRIRF